MSKQKDQGFKIEDFGHVNDGLIKRIEGVIADRKMSRLSSSAIYKAHNELFKLREPIQTCQSCLVIRGDKLAKWYEWYAKQAAPQTQGIQMPVTNVGTGNEPDPAAAQATYDLEDGRVLTVAADGSVQIDGEAAPEDAAYKLADGTDIAVFEGQLITKKQEIEVKGAGKAKQILLQKIDKDDYTKTDGDPFYAAFSASEADAQKGKAVETETGKAVKPGTYATEDTAFVLSVSVGGAASYKAVQ